MRRLILIKKLMSLLLSLLLVMSSIPLCSFVARADEPEISLNEEATEGVCTHSFIQEMSKDENGKDCVVKRCIECGEIEKLDNTQIQFTYSILNRNEKTISLNAVCVPNDYQSSLYYANCYWLAIVFPSEINGYTVTKISSRFAKYIDASRQHDFWYVFPETLTEIDDYAFQSGFSDNRLFVFKNSDVNISKFSAFSNTNPYYSFISLDTDNDSKVKKYAESNSVQWLYHDHESSHYMFAETPMGLSSATFSCSEDAHIEGTCFYCGQYVNEEHLAGEHIGEQRKQSSVASTCHEAGYQKYYCTTCQQYYTEDLPLREHDWQKQNTISPTCTEEGYTRYVCYFCKDEKREDVIAPLGHQFCNPYDSSIKYYKHIDGTETHRNYCFRCGEFSDEPAQPCKFYYEEIHNKTVSTPGYVTTYCSECEYEKNIGEIAHGIAGPSATFELNVNSNHITISGTGSVEYLKLNKYSTGQAPGIKYYNLGLDKHYSVSINEGITDIADGVFEGGSKTEAKIYITDISLPMSLKSIGSRAFYQSSLNNFVANEGLEYIGEEAFKGAKAMKTVTLNSGIKRLGNSAFESCEGLTKVNNYPYIDNIPESCFKGCYQLSSFTIPNTVKFINTEAFKESGLTSIDIPDSVELISNYAFDQAAPYIVPKLKSISLGNSVRKIGKMAFRGVLEDNLVLPYSLKEIDDGAFCTASLENVELNEGLERIGNHAFSRTHIKSVNIPSTVFDLSYTSNTKINFDNDYGNPTYDDIYTLIYETAASESSGAFALDYELQAYVVSPDNKNYYSENGILYNKNKTALVHSPISVEIEDLEISESVTDIYHHAFFSNNTLKSIQISGEIDNIKAATFAESNIHTIEFLRSCGDIKPFAFFSASSLKSITLPEGVSKIGAEAFAYCKNLSNIEANSALEEIGEGAFKGCSSLTDIILPKAVVSVADDAFAYCNLGSVHFENPKAICFSSATRAKTSFAHWGMPHNEYEIIGADIIPRNPLSIETSQDYYGRKCQKCNNWTGSIHGYVDKISSDPIHIYTGTSNPYGLCPYGCGYNYYGTPEIYKWTVDYDVQNDLCKETVQPQSKSSTVTIPLSVPQLNDTPIDEYVTRTFVGWNDKKDGSGTFYSNEIGNTLFSKNADMRLYGIWQDEGEYPNFTVRYNVNNEFCEELVDEQSWSAQDNHVVLTAPELSAIELENSSIHFVEWNTEADGTGVAYKTNDLYAEHQDLMLYAIWEVVEKPTLPDEEPQPEIIKPAEEPTSPPPPAPTNTEIKSPNTGNGLGLPEIISISLFGAVFIFAFKKRKEN